MVGYWFFADNFFFSEMPTIVILLYELVIHTLQVNSIQRVSTMIMAVTIVMVDVTVTAFDRLLVVIAA